MICRLLLEETILNKITDPSYLRDQQYKTSKNLSARINLHVRFGTTSESWTRWIIDQLQLQSGQRWLEVGCGPASLWQENRALVPAGMQAVLSDFSFGMVKEASTSLSGMMDFHFLNVDVQSIPYASQTFDGVIANHMLYHVPDLDRGLKEIRRVLKPGGRLFAATNGNGHMRELIDLIRRIAPGYAQEQEITRSFTLENAPQVLSGHFSNVQVRRFLQDLDVTEFEPLRDYIFSMWNVIEDRDPNEIETYEADLKRNFEEQGHMHISKSQGLVIAGR
jgi:ubiquinone/menaquinone biosynthesis C-methylase UbiE